MFVKIYTYGTPGFELDLPFEIDVIDKSSKISLIALNANGNKVIELVDKKKTKNL